ncbi:histidine phosphatase family protein [Actinomadura parmotrematis]|uniref:Histidine phosphatase family protein n=1 Tax=Actinomadura parmotrematis TaxID=2864039 RepID=A0ABS7FQA5_9ACTN|nr:histidine phosphatase family protein [Actinomadura parmotrematis]MBW8482594.1 histidine phosphatase family protein [Actinomadura parmotrematis]
MTRIVLVRHGETVWHEENRYAGSSDVALTANGIRQAERLAAWAADAGLAAVYSSDLKRARITAEHCARAAGLPPRADARLRELDFGDGEGLTRAEMRDRFPAALDAFLRTPASAPLPGGEDPAAAAARFTACLDDLTRRHEGGRVLVVAHSTAIRLALCGLLGLPLDGYRRLFPELRNCARTEIRRDGAVTGLLELNAGG